MKKGERQGLNMVVELIAHIRDHPSANVGCQLLRGKEHRASNREQANDHERQNRERGLVLVGKNIVENFPGEVSDSPAGATIDYHADDGDGQMRP